MKLGSAMQCQQCGGVAIMYDDGTKAPVAMGPRPCTCESPAVGSEPTTQDRHGPVRTVGELMYRLTHYDPEMPVRTAHAGTGNSDRWEWIINVAPLPPANEMLGLLYLEPSD